MLHTNQISYQIASQRLFENITVSLDSRTGKKVALVGQNGCGKSTLLKILIREIDPTSGSLSLLDETLGYLPQEWVLPENQLVGEFLENKLEETWMDYKIDKALNDVGLTEDYLIKDIKNLSGGEKVKVYLAGILLDEPTILLLDEPTNNLDSAGVIWLENFIENFRGSVIVVSHDRYLINRMINEIWEINPDTKGIRVFGGNYDFFLAEKKRLDDKQLQEYENERQKISELKKWLKMWEFHPKYQFSAIVMSKKKKLAQLLENQKPKPTIVTKIKIHNLDSQKNGLVVSAKITSKKFGQKEILKDLNFKLHEDERLLICGENGSGKTTLLNILVDEDKNFDGEIFFGDNLRIGYLKQFSDLNKDKSIQDVFEEKTGLMEPKSRSVLARFLFPADKIKSAVGTLSYGQLKRLDLAIILTLSPNLLILDEPTNHLDIYLREELEAFIMEQQIPMIIVSHDRYFIEKINFTDSLEFKKI